jgi:hypothetical protein
MEFPHKFSEIIGDIRKKKYCASLGAEYKSATSPSSVSLLHAIAEYGGALGVLTEKCYQAEESIHDITQQIGDIMVIIENIYY